MKKITLMALMLFGMMLGIVSPSTEASEITVVSEKIWTIKLNDYVLDTKENLQHVQLLNENGETVPAVIEVNRSNAKVIDVYPLSSFAVGQYTIVVNSGLQSFEGVTLTESVEKSFTVDRTLSVEAINGSWTTIYEYQKSPYEVNVTFKDGEANIQLKDILSGTTFKSKKLYTVENGFMNMSINELDLNLSGDILVYSDREFKIVTKGGKFSYFHKK